MNVKCYFIKMYITRNSSYNVPTVSIHLCSAKAHQSQHVWTPPLTIFISVSCHLWYFLKFPVYLSIKMFRNLFLFLMKFPLPGLWVLADAKCWYQCVCVPPVETKALQSVHAAILLVGLSRLKSCQAFLKF